MDRWVDGWMDEWKEGERTREKKKGGEMNIGTATHILSRKAQLSVLPLCTFGK